jgi:guanine deaminase
MSPSSQSGPAGSDAYLARAIALSRESMESGSGGPFGAVIVRAGRILAEGTNRVTATNDPTAHAEIVAIRDAARALGDFRLTGCDLYASCEPCPMCLAAAHWARVDRIVFAASREDAARAGFDDAFLYQELAEPLAARSIPTIRIPSPEAAAVLKAWTDFPGRVPY